MKNFSIIYDKTGREYWISRSVAVVVLIKAVDLQGNEYVLAEQRGKGTPDPEFVGTWCLPCGYLDYDETLIEAARREVFEETGLQFAEEDFKLISINDNPNSDKRQNVTFRYKLVSPIPVEGLNRLLTTKYSEKEEVSDIKFIKLEEINNYKWAFNHVELIKEIL